MTTFATDPVLALWAVYDAAVANGDTALAEQARWEINELCGLPREWLSLSERNAEKVRGMPGYYTDRCPNCEYTQSGFFAHPCEVHGCPDCGHLIHDAEDGCGHPDPRTGWCECAAGSAEKKREAGQ